MPQTDTANVIPELAGGWNDGLACFIFRFLKRPHVKSRGLADTEKIMPAGLMPAAIRPILKLSFTKDVLRSRQLSVFRLPDVSHFFAF